MYESVTGTVLSFFGFDSGSELAELGSDCKSIKFTGIILFFISLESLNEANKKIKIWIQNFVQHTEFKDDRMENYGSYIGFISK